MEKETIGSDSANIGLFTPITPALVVMWIIRKRQLRNA